MISNFKKDLSDKKSVIVGPKIIRVISVSVFFYKILSTMF